jgi:uncharacterized protein (DUF2384 family)
VNSATASRAAESADELPLVGAEAGEHQRSGFFEGSSDRRVIAYASLRAKLAHECSDIVHAGIEASAVGVLAEDLKLDQSVLATALRIRRRNTRKPAMHPLLSSEDSAKVLGVAQLVGEAERILSECGDRDRMEGFSAAAWMGRWLTSPLGALDFRRPLDYVDNSYGQALVMQLLGRIQSGAFS